MATIAQHTNIQLIENWEQYGLSYQHNWGGGQRPRFWTMHELDIASHLEKNTALFDGREVNGLAVILANGERSVLKKIKVMDGTVFVILNTGESVPLSKCSKINIDISVLTELFN